MTDTEIPTLLTPRLRLRAHRAGDFGASAALWADPAVTRFIGGEPSSAEVSWARMLRSRGSWAMLGFGYWVVEARADGAFLGEVGFGDFRREMAPPLDASPEAGWVLTTAAQGRGIGAEAAARMLGWADAALPAAETVCVIAPEHAASVKLARLLGYRPRGTALYRGAETLVMARPRADRADRTGF